MSTTPTPEQTPDVTKPSGPNLRWLWIVALVAVIAVAGIVLWFVFSGGAEEPILTFDGTTATYSGPDTFVAGEEVTFTAENQTSEMVTFGWSRNNDETITLEEEIAWMETHRGSSYEIPPWVEDYGGFTPAFSDDVREGSVVFEAGKGLLWVWDARERIIYPAAHITASSD
jgi:hypothetical protein